MREDLRKAVDELPEIVPNELDRYEIHMLCGHRDIDMGILASWSLMRFMAGKGRLIVHSDGTLKPNDETRWRQVVGRVDLISRDEGDRTVFGTIPHLRELSSWRSTNWASAQLVDAQLFGDKPALLVMDSDVLVFKKPDALLSALDARSPRFQWGEDLMNAYSADLETIREVTGVRIPQKLCAGFMVTPRLNASDFERLNAYMEAIRGDGRIDLDHFWSCQTYYALLASDCKKSCAFPSDYRNTRGKTRENQIVRHYVGIPSVRYRYFTEGASKLDTRSACDD